MISAAEARERTEQAALLKKIETYIKKCSKKGMYTLFMQIEASTEEYIRETIREKLYSLGYEYNIPSYNKDHKCLFDVIEISWEENRK